MSTEVADCILLKEWYKHSTQSQYNPKTQCFTLTLGISLKSAFSHSHTLPEIHLKPTELPTE
jgi:hypothetical protein